MSVLSESGSAPVGSRGISPCVVTGEQYGVRVGAKHTYPGGSITEGSTVGQRVAGGADDEITDLSATIIALQGQLNGCLERLVELRRARSGPRLHLIGQEPARALPARPALRRVRPLTPDLPVPVALN